MKNVKEKYKNDVNNNFIKKQLYMSFNIDL